MDLVSIETERGLMNSSKTLRQESEHSKSIHRKKRFSLAEIVEEIEEAKEGELRIADRRHERALDDVDTLSYNSRKIGRNKT